MAFSCRLDLHRASHRTESRARDNPKSFYIVGLAKARTAAYFGVKAGASSKHTLARCSSVVFSGGSY